jgi:glycosyltransferase involved in cell wall biosynthesis
VFGVRAPRVQPGQVNGLWVISHPDRVTESLCQRYDVVFSASDLLIQRLEARVRVPLVSLHQATEPARFYPDPTGPHHQLLFIGNSRMVPRPIIEDLRGSEFDLSVYGGNWTPELLEPRYLKGAWVPNDELRRYYSSADVVLNDHWGDMRELGIISNRIYDALACGAFVVSDRVPGLDEEFDGAVVAYGTRDELHELLRRYLADPAARAEAGARGRAAVLERHTFAHRVDRIVTELMPRALARPRTMDDPVGVAADG